MPAAKGMSLRTYTIGHAHVLCPTNQRVQIRCDKRSPCSNCRTSKIICSSTGAGQKPREPRKRVLISNE